MTFSRLTVQPSTLVQMAEYPPGATFGPRRLVDYEFVWILAGSALWTVRDEHAQHRLAEQRYQLQPGMLALARAGNVDYYQWDESRASSHAYVHFALADPGQLGDEADWPPTRTVAGTPILEGICAYLLQLAGQQSVQSRRRSDELVALLLDVFITGPLDEPDRALPAYLSALVEHVRTSWIAGGMRIVGVAELAAAGHVSAGHLFRLFRAQYGCGPARALELVRLARAAVSLQRSNATLAQIAELCGFANPYHFSRRFAEVYGAPPGTFRRFQFDADPLRPIREAGLLPVAHALMSHAPELAVTESS